MQELARYQRPAFLNDHPPVLARMDLTGTPGTTLPAGAVLGRTKDGELGLWTSGRTVAGILAGDLEIPASGKALADVYIHASVVAGELVFAGGVTAGEQLQALAALRGVGIYSSVTWAASGDEEPVVPETPKEGEE